METVFLVIILLGAGYYIYRKFKPGSNDSCGCGCGCSKEEHPDKK